MLSVCFMLLQDTEDEPLFEEFYEKYNKYVYYIAKGKLNNHQLAEECVQEVFIKIAKKFHNIKEKVYDNNIRGLVKLIAENTAIDIYRKNKKHIKNAATTNMSGFCTLTDDDFDFCNTVLLKDAIDNLPEEIKHIFYLKYVYGYSGAEIAELLGITESLVRKRCMLGRHMAKKYIEGDKNE